LRVLRSISEPGTLADTSGYSPDLKRPRAAIDGHRIGPLLDLHEQTPVGHRLGGPGDAAVQPLQRERAPSAGQPHPVGHFGDRAHGRELLPVTGHEQYTLFVAGLDGQRERHAREDDDVVQRDEKKAAHQVFTFSSCLRIISSFENTTRPCGFAVDLSLMH
jgi:hypothetical protein